MSTGEFAGAAEDARILTRLRATVDAIKAHLRARHGDDPRAANITAKLRDVQLLPPRPGSTPRSYVSGLFVHTTGVLMVAPRDGAGRVRTPASLNKTIVHELAHATRFKHFGESSHSKEWKAAFVWLLDVATRELGMDVEVGCSVVKYYGLTREMCPWCIWDTPTGGCGASEPLA